MTRFKVCGLTRPIDVTLCLESGASFLGFIFAAKSPRRITPETARAMPRGQAKRVGVLVEQSADEAQRLIDEAELDYVQLHGGQNADYCLSVGPGKVIKVFWPQRYCGVADLQADLDKFAAYCSYFLFDAGISGGGHGKSLDFKSFFGLNFRRPWFLAGGLSPDNLGEALRLARPDVVDLNSGLEISPGIKDAEKVRQAALICAQLEK